jgi:tetratricopeptide (TPR) repeat protein
VEAHRRGDYQSALEKARAGTAEFHIGRSPDWHWRFRLLEAETLISTGSASEAIELLQVRSSAKPASGRLEARRLLNLGWARSFLAEHETALDLLGQACLLSERAGDRESLAQAELRRGTVFGYVKRHEESERSYLRSLELARDLGDSYLEGSALGSVGFLRLNNARYEEAIFYFDQVLPLARRIQSRSLEALTIQNLAWCYLRLGDLDKSSQRFEQAQALLGAMGKKREYQISLGNIGSAWFMRGDFRRAISYYERALAVARQLKHQSSEADWLSNLALAYIELGDSERAAALNGEARKLRRDSGDRETVAWLSVNEGRILELRGDPAGAEARYRQVVESGMKEPMTLFEARARLARLVAHNGRHAEADREYRELLAGLEAYRGSLAQQDWKITWQSSLIRFYKDYVAFLWRQGRREAALEVAESSRARVLAERLGDAKVSAAPAVSRMKRLARQNGCTLLSYWLAPGASYLWTISAGGITAHELPPQGEIASAVESYRRTIERLRDPLEAVQPAVERLSSLLLGAVQDRRGCFLLSPDQELHGLNFETLPVPDGRGGFRYWIENAELSVVPSLALAPGAGGTDGSSALLLGDPVSPDPMEFPPLANAGAEIDAIARRLAPTPATIIRGGSATPGAYQRSDPVRFGLIHIAAHATANRESPLDSAIILTRAGERHSLTAREIARIPVRAKLVTISACRGAGSRAYAGEGTVGLAWGFLHAGARNVVAGLWAVDDYSTSRLMQTMYAGIAGGASPASSLRAAKLEMIRSATAMRKPYYWAPFQLYRLP